jgi:hypothetical protein
MKVLRVTRVMPVRQPIMVTLLANSVHAAGSAAVMVTALPLVIATVTMDSRVSNAINVHKMWNDMA